MGSYTDLVGLLTRGSSTDSLTPDNANLFWLSDMDSAAGGGEGTKDSDRVDALMFPDDDGIPTVSSGEMENTGTVAHDHMALQLMSSTAARQHCEADVISALARLDLPSFSCRGESKCSQNLGIILTASRSALSSASKAVSCTCKPNANVALLVTAVLFRILSWYEIVLQNCRGSYGDGSNCGGIGGGSVGFSDGLNSPATSSESDDAERPLTQERGVGAAQDGTADNSTSKLFVPPMTIGSYELDAENRERMIGHIVLSELGKMGRLMDNFSRKFCGPHSIVADSDSPSHIHLALEMFIRSKHSLMVLAAQAKSDAK